MGQALSSDMSFSKERKRTRGEIACAECRRLKARCDRQVPCSTCLRRGCDVLCPNSTMPPGEGSRFVSAAEEFLRRKIMKMEERMRLLEDALVIVHGAGSCKQYPLPSGESSSTGREMEWAPEVDHDQTMDEFNKCGLADTLGALYLVDEWAPFETLCGSKNLLVQAKAFITESSSPANHAEEIDFSYLPPEINMFYQAFPFTPTGIPTEHVQDLIVSYLPPFSRAVDLCETFLQSMSWIFNVVSRQHIMGDLVPMVYRHAGGQTSTQPRPYGPHDISLLFIVFAIGTVVDSSLPPYNVEGQHYHMLSRAALCLQPVFTQRSVVTIKTLNLMSIYNGMCGIESKLEHSFSLLGLAAHVALQIGFHKDPSVWGITGREAYERRTYFWNLLSGTLWQSLVSGQPPVIMPSMIGCHIPTEEEEDTYQLGEVPLGFGIWSFSFITQCLVPVMEVTQGIRAPSYDTVLALDVKIREFSISSSERTLGDLQASVRSQLREITLLFLHRAFFAQALADFPLNPLRSPLRHSFLSAYQSATRVLGTTRRQFAQQPAFCARVWRIWSFAFSAAVIVATVAIKRFSVNLEPEPFEQLELACGLFHEAARVSIRAQNALPILLRLRQEATQIRPEAAHAESGGAVSRETRGAIHSVPYSGVSFSSALPIPVVHSPLARIVESDEESYGGTHQAAMPLESQGLYREKSPSIHLASYGLSRAPYTPQPQVHGDAPQDWWTSTMHEHTGAHTHPRPP